MRQLVWTDDRTARWREAPDPVLAGPGEALVRPVAVACCDLDVAIVRGRAPVPGGWPVGHEGVGEVLDIGDAVTTVAPGDLVALPFQVSCGTCPQCRLGRSGVCASVPALSTYGLGPLSGAELGGFLADAVRVPYADAMLVTLPPGVDPRAVASISDNLPDAWRTVGPYAAELDALDPPDRRVLVLGGLSIGLYATAIGRALGVDVDYVDRDPHRRAVAERLGARLLDEPPGRETPRYPVVVTTIPDPARLLAAVRSTASGGVCTDTGIFYGNDTPLPLLELYSRAVRFTTGIVMARPAIPPLLDLVASGALRPAEVTARVVPWSDADQAWPVMTSKTVFVR